MKILLVEDEPAARRLITMMLAKEHQVLAVEGVEEALGLIAAEPWDLVLTDYKMPGMSGLALVETMAEKRVEIPVIMITGQGSADKEIADARHRMRKILSKPFSRHDLMAAIAEIFPSPAA